MFVSPRSLQLARGCCSSTLHCKQLFLPFARYMTPMAVWQQAEHLLLPFFQPLYEMQISCLVAEVSARSLMVSCKVHVSSII